MVEIDVGPLAIKAGLPFDIAVQGYAPYNQLLEKLGGQKRLLENMERNAEVGISLLRDD